MDSVSRENILAWRQTLLNDRKTIEENIQKLKESLRRQREHLHQIVGGLRTTEWLMTKLEEAEGDSVEASTTGN